MIRFEEFLEEWDKTYKLRAKTIAMFAPELVSKWSKEQKQRFALIFYHARGHFHDFLWYMGNHATDKETKDIVLKNIAEELNSSAMSHEQMYFEFAKSLDVDVSDEFINEQHYLGYIKSFNHGHMQWLHTHDAEERLGAFAAYERLDNIDYANLLELVIALGVSKKGQVFFKVHSLVEHFAPAAEKIKAVWDKDQEKIKASFNFIGDHQIKMWQNISDDIFVHNLNV